MSRINDLGARRRTLEVTTRNANLPVSVAELKQSLRIAASVTSDDAFLTSLINSATSIIEKLYSISVLTKNYTLYMDDIDFKTLNEPSVAQGINSTYVAPTRPLSEVRVRHEAINLMCYPVTAISAFTYYDENNTELTWASSNYVLDSGARPCRLLKNFQNVWPQDIFRPGSAIKIEFTAGWADASQVPPEIKMAIQRYAESLYMNRGCNDGEGALPGSVKAMLVPWTSIRL